MRHDKRTLIESPSGMLHFWRSHEPRRTFCGMATKPSWTVRANDSKSTGFDTMLGMQPTGAISERLCSRCSELDDKNGFSYYHGDDREEPRVWPRWCVCGHEQARHALDFGRVRKRCLECTSCEAFQPGPLEDDPQSEVEGNS